MRVLFCAWRFPFARTHYFIKQKTATGIVLYLMTVIIRTLVAILFFWMSAPLLPIA